MRVRGWVSAGLVGLVVTAMSGAVQVDAATVETRGDRPTPYVLLDVHQPRAEQVVPDGRGGLLVYSRSRGTVSRVTLDGRVTVVAGNGEAGPLVDGPATATPLGWIEDLAVGPDGTLYLADHDNLAIAEVRDGRLRVVPGATRGTPSGVAVDGAGALVVADCGARTVTRFAPDGTATVLLDRSIRDGFFPRRLETAPDGRVLVEDTGNGVVEAVAPDGTATVLPGSEGWYLGSLAAAADGTTWFASAGGDVGRLDPDGTVSLLQPRLDPSGDPTAIVTVGVLPDGRLMLAPDQGDALYVVAPDDLARPSADPVAPSWDVERSVARDGRRVWATVRVALHGDEGAPAVTGTVAVEVYGRSSGPVELVEGRATVRVRAPRAPGRYAGSITYSGDGSYLAGRRELTVTVRR